MFLHSDGKRFTEIIDNVFKATGVPKALIEKDYFVTIFLKRLAEKEPLLVFKGGTCLSKCFRLVKRFSEDIDINLFGMEDLSSRRKKQMKYNIVETINDLDLKLSNPEDVRSGRDHNIYKVSYPAVSEDPSLKTHLEVETYFLIGSFPTVNMGVTSLIYDRLKELGLDNIISECGLEPFQVRVQSLERTFADKIFAMCDYYMTGKINGQSRHLYDIHKILPHMTLNDDLKDFIGEVRKVREGKRDCLSAAKDVSLPGTIDTVMANNAYKRDYNERTAPLLYETVAYADIASSMRKIADWLR
ncbi:MAG: nucleotidyl transferase AbiEii/AbiGii toxin family protein [Methanomassiliicoccaceae archaeon]|jgi:predicted nucleotidyltransferase component of viral defense system|nr:nucleotidyl transferase AbiEii/AbiGii toxin family protein [Methanomassiliicoccaceae archaeon]